jgi:serine/threonine-protein kinase
MRPFPALPAFVPADVRALVAQLTAKDAADRPRSAAEVARQARQLGDRLVSTSGLAASKSAGLLGPAGESRPADRPTAAESHFRRPPRSAVVGGAAAALIVLAVLVGVNIGDPEPGSHPAGAPSSSAARPAPSATRPGASATRPKTPTAVAVTAAQSSPQASTPDGSDNGKHKGKGKGKGKGNANGNGNG